MTSEERREVAERLRDEADGHVAVECGSVAHALGLAYEVHGTIAAFSGDAVARLADLIDPTCHAVHSDTAADDELVCSECGAYMGAIVPFIGAVLPLYCPSCGARVVEGGDV